MSAVQSSGSICSASLVEPTTSTKSAVTGLRSPVSRAARIFVMSGVGAAAVRAGVGRVRVDRRRVSGSRVG